MKKEKYNIITYHCEAFAIDLEVSKKAFEKALKDAQAQAMTEGIKGGYENANDKGEYMDMRYTDAGTHTITTFIVGCGCSETQFIKKVCKDGYAFK